MAAEETLGGYVNFEKCFKSNSVMADHDEETRDNKLSSLGAHFT